jgi:uncharacterized protein YlxW (UPF0749 family)
LGILLLTNVIYAAEPSVCFSEEDSKKIVVQLEDLADYKEQIEILKQQTAELEKQVKLLKEVASIQKEQLEFANKSIESYQTLLKTQQESYEKEIKNQKPSIFSKIYTTIGAVGIGVLVGLLL